MTQINSGRNPTNGATRAKSSGGKNKSICAPPFHARQPSSPSQASTWAMKRMTLAFSSSLEFPFVPCWQSCQTFRRRLWGCEGVTNTPKLRGGSAPTDVPSSRRFHGLLRCCLPPHLCLPDVRRGSVLRLPVYREGFRVSLSSRIRLGRLVIAGDQKVMRLPFTNTINCSASLCRFPASSSPHLWEITIYI